MPGERILVVDDEPIVLRNCKRILEEEGFSVGTAKSGEEALEKLKKESFDLVITDLMMLAISGMELLGRVKKIQPKVEVMMITGYGTVPSSVEAMKRGAFNYLQKPFTPEELIKETQEAIKKRKGEIQFDHRGPLLSPERTEIKAERAPYTRGELTGTEDLLQVVKHVDREKLAKTILIFHLPNEVHRFFKEKGYNIISPLSKDEVVREIREHKVKVGVIGSQEEEVASLVSEEGIPVVKVRDEIPFDMKDIERRVRDAFEEIAHRILNDALRRVSGVKMEG